MVDFAALLNKPTESAVKPPPLPAGDYLWGVTKYTFGESDKKKTPYVEFNLQCLQASPEIDPVGLQGIDLTKRTRDLTFYLTDDALWRLRDFLEKSLVINGQGRTFMACLPEAVGKQFIGTVDQQPSQRPGDDSIYNNIVAHRAP